MEWIELMGILGATKIFTFDLNMSEELRQLFKYYEKTGLKRKQEHTFLYDLLPERIFWGENENEYLFHSIARQLELKPPLN